MYRIFPLWFFEEVLRSRQLVLVAPHRWEDPFDPSEAFDEVTFEPRLAPTERESRENAARGLGYRGKFRVSDLYRQTRLEIVLPGGWGKK